MKTFFDSATHRHRFGRPDIRFRPECNARLKLATNCIQPVRHAFRYARHRLQQPANRRQRRHGLHHRLRFDCFVPTQPRRITPTNPAHRYFPNPQPVGCFGIQHFVFVGMVACRFVAAFRAQRFKLQQPALSGYRSLHAHHRFLVHPAPVQLVSPASDCCR